jgi:hypothetical protein
MRVVLTYLAITLLEFEYTTYAHVSAVERLCLLGIIRCIVYVVLQRKSNSFLGFSR